MQTKEVSAAWGQVVGRLQGGPGLSCFVGSCERLWSKAGGKNQTYPAELPSLGPPDGRQHELVFGSESAPCPLLGEVAWPIHWQNVKIEC